MGKYEQVVDVDSLKLSKILGKTDKLRYDDSFQIIVKSLPFLLSIGNRASKKTPVNIYVLID